MALACEEHHTFARVESLKGYTETVSVQGGPIGRSRGRKAALARRRLEEGRMVTVQMPKARRPDADKLRFGHLFPVGSANNLLSNYAAQAAAPYTRAMLLEEARACEEVGFDFLFLADGWTGHNQAAERAGFRSPSFVAPLLGMALATVTEHIGIITTIDTTSHRPAHAARIGATLDAYSDGRWGWNIVTGYQPPEAALFGHPPVAHDERYDMATEFVEAVLALWTEDDVVEFAGRYHTVRGRIKAPRPLQDPYPFLLNAGGSPAGTALSARYCDYQVILARAADDVIKAAQRLASLAGGYGRDPRAARVVPFALAMVRDGDGEAEEEYARCLATLDEESVLGIAGDIYGSVESAREMFNSVGQDEAMRRIGGGQAMLPLIGRPADVAETLITLHRETDAAAVLVEFVPWGPARVRDFAKVFDALREAGVWDPPAQHEWSW